MSDANVFNGHYFVATLPRGAHSPPLHAFALTFLFLPRSFVKFLHVILGCDVLSISLLSGEKRKMKMRLGQTKHRTK